jgi:hypothetical protein
MDKFKNRRLSAAHRFAFVVLCPGLLLLFSSGISAQFKMTAKPNSITDATKPGQVVLQVTKEDGTAVEAPFREQVGSVKVGDDTAPHQFGTAPGDINITPPANRTGAQTVQLLNKQGQQLAQTQLQYPAAGGSNPPAGGSNPAPTTTPTSPNEPLKLPANWGWFFAIVSGLYAALMIPFVYTIYRVIRFSRSSFRNPLGFPVGSFRAMLAYTLVAYMGFYVLTSILSFSDFRPPESILGIVATVIGFYFGNRTGEEGTVDPGTAGIVRGIVRIGTNPARGATVKFKREDGTEPYSRITDIDGRFDLVGAKPGKYKVRAEASGSPPSDGVDVNVTEGSDQEIVITIKAAASPTTGTVEGTVTKADKTPAEGAKVVLTQGAAKTEKTTDAKGKYKFDNVPVGEGSVAVAGSTTEPKKITVAAGASQTVDIELK